MIVISINHHISARPGMKIVNAGAAQGFFLIYYAPEDAPDGAAGTLAVYFNQDGKEVFTVEE